MQNHSTTHHRQPKPMLRKSRTGLVTSLLLISLILPACRDASESSRKLIGNSDPALNQTANTSAQGAAAREASDQQDTFMFEGERVRAAQFVGSGERCATRPVPAVEVQGIQRRIERFKSMGRNTTRDATAPPIQVHFHVINKGSDPNNDGNLTDQQIASQMDVLNNAYAGTHFRFQLANITRTTNPEWFMMSIGSDEEAAAKQALGVKQKNVLNIYTARLAGRTLGWAVFPWDASMNPYDDGVVIRFSTIPNGASAPYNLGDTTVHEVGHWLGLLHTFEGGCMEPGDSVGDTPAEALAAFDCEERDTCPSGAGSDPIRNFMDYTDDSCMNSFTNGQTVRMDEMFALYRQS